MYLGSWAVNDYVTFPCNTYDPATLVATDADAQPTYRVYLDEDGSPVANGVMAKLDDANTTGFYSERLWLSSVSGFLAGKSYTIYMEALVGASKIWLPAHSFQCKAEVNVKTIESTAQDALVDAIFDELRAGHVAAGSVGELLQDQYHADIHFQVDDDETKDRYVVRWFKNGVRQTSGITSPQISVYDLTDGSALINSQSMSDVGSGMLLYTETTNRQTMGTPYEVIVTATIGGATRTWSKDLGRDI